MATAPDRIRTALQRVTSAAKAELQAVAAAAPQDPVGLRAALFATAPLIVSDYAPGAATLSLDWFEEIRDDANPPNPYTPTPRLLVTDDDVAASVATTTRMLYEIEQGLHADLDKAVADSLALLESEVQKAIALGFWDTTTGNAADDPDAAGWQRFTRSGACKFCAMLADRGAVFTQATARFAAHTDCHCVAGPSYNPDAPKASVMQYLASSRKRSAADKARLRDYLTQHFPDAPG